MLRQKNNTKKSIINSPSPIHKKLILLIIFVMIIHPGVNINHGIQLRQVLTLEIPPMLIVSLKSFLDLFLGT
jgi:hypothetical protein